MNTLIRKTSLPVIAVMLAGVTGMAQESATGTLTGVVKDAKGAPVVGAIVTISSPALFAPRVIKTSDKGEWRAPLLPTGSYRVAVRKDGYVGSTAENLRVGLGTASRQDLVIKPMTEQSATVEVVADAATVTAEKTKTETSKNLSGDMMASMPTANRGWEGAASLTPGVVASAGNGQYSIAGGMTNSTQYRVNGIDIQSDYQGTRNATGALADMIEDVQVITSPLNARNGRTTGGAINVVTKSGGNTFSGSARAYWDRESWSANKPGMTADTIAATGDGLNKRLEATFMGPIIKDRLWFTVGTRLTPGESYSKKIANYGVNYNEPIATAGYNKPWQTGTTAIDNVLNAGPGGTYKWAKFDQGLSYLVNSDSSYYEGKLTFAVTGNHTLEGYISNEKSTIYHRDSGLPYATYAMLGNQKEDTTLWSLGYRGVLTDKLFVEARAAALDGEVYWPTSVDPVIKDSFLLYANNSSSNALYGFSTRRAPIGPELRGNRSFEVNFKYYLDAAGSHDIDFGYQNYQSRRKTIDQWGPQNRRFRAGGVFVDDAGSYLFPTLVFTGPGQYGQSSTGVAGPALVMETMSGRDGENKVINQGLYFNDNWTISEKLSVMGGLRIERYEVVENDGSNLTKATDYSPRIQLKYDPTGNADHLLTFSAAQYIDNITTTFTSLFATTGQAYTSTIGWTGKGINQAAPGDAANNQGVRFVDYNAITDMHNWTVDGSADAKKLNLFRLATVKQYEIDPGLKPPKAIELQAAYTRAYGVNNKLSVTATWKTWRSALAQGRDWAPENFPARVDPLTGNSTLVQKITVFNSDDLKREYKALTFDLSQSLSSNWRMEANVTYSRLMGNDNYGDGTDTAGFRDNGVNAYYDQRIWLTQGLKLSDSVFSPNGFLRAHQEFKGRLTLLGTYPLGRGGNVTYAFIMAYNSGGRYSAADTRNLNMPNLTAAQTASLGGLPAPTKPATFNYFYSGRGAYGYNDDFRCDFKLSYQIPLGLGKVALVGDMFVNNLFNHQVQSGYYVAYTGATNGSNFLGARYVGANTQFGTTQPGDPASPDYFINARSVTMSIGLKF